ncbi:MFS transporter [Streptomyces sp. 3211]|uniref:MFS transporter n=1 Tax=Streptomyces sp. 3211 TaxID=1964449 RepID=UPI0009A4EAAE|nr:MFS transporter [Streptomyces sp. 3211]
MRLVHKGLGRYRRLLSEPGMAGCAVAALASKLQGSMFTLSLLLTVASGRSYAVAGAVAAVSALGGIAAPVRGRLLDRLSYASVLWSVLALHAALVTLIVVNEAAHGPLLLTFAGALAANTVAPPVGVLTRVMWRSVTTEETRSTALALDAVLADAGFIVGPLLVGVLSSVFVPHVALGAGVLISALATVLLLRALDGREPAKSSGKQQSWMGSLTSIPLRLHLGCALLFSAAVGVVEVSLISHGGDLLGSLSVSVLSAGSIVGGLVIGALPPVRAAQVSRLPRLLSYLGLAATALAVAGTSQPVVFIALTLAVGMAFGPCFVAVYGLTGDLAPIGTAAEAQAWVGAALQGGAALGQAAGAFAFGLWGFGAGVGLAPAFALMAVGLGLFTDLLRRPVTAQ